MTLRPELQQLVKGVDQLLLQLPVVSTFRSYALSPEVDLLPEIETLLANEPSNADAKLLWFFLHVRKGEIPFAALVSTFDDLSADSTFDQDADKLFAVSSLKFVRGLVERTQLRLAIAPLEHLLQRALFAGSLGIAAVDVLEQFYSEEILRAESKRENKAYLNSLRERKDGLAHKRKSLAENSRSSASSPVANVAEERVGIFRNPKKKQYLNSKALLEDALKLERESSTADVSEIVHSAADLPGEKSPALDTSSVVDTHTNESPSQDPWLKGRSSTRVNFLPFGVSSRLVGLQQYSRQIGLTLAGGVLVWLAWFSFFTDSAEFDVSHRLAVGLENVEPDALAFQLPDPGPAVIHGGGSVSMRELTLRLSGMKNGKRVGDSLLSELPAGAQNLPASVPSSDSGTPTTSDAPTGVAMAPFIPGATPPSVPASPQPTIDGPHDLGSDKIPRPSKSDLARSIVSDLGTAPSPKLPPPIGGPKGLVVGPDGRTYGPPPAVSRTLDGEPVQGYPVDEFSTPQLYRVVTSTKVLSAPSIVASPLAELQRDAVIHVVARMGRWLEVQSSGGRRGFIHSQDAVPEAID